MKREMIFTAANAAKGEMAVRAFSAEALEAYNGEDVRVYDYRGADGTRLYAYDGVYGEATGLSFEELEEFFKDIYDEMYTVVEEEEEEEEEEDAEPHRVTCDYWQGIPAGETVGTGFLAGTTELTAPAEEGTYTLYQLADSNNCHVGFEWVKD